jgi:hypothetical protein
VGVQQSDDIPTYGMGSTCLIAASRGVVQSCGYNGPATSDLRALDEGLLSAGGPAPRAAYGIWSAVDVSRTPTAD